MKYDHVLSRLRIRDKIISPITAKIASNPGVFFEFGVGFTVGDVVPDVVSASPSAPSSLGDVGSEVDARSALSLVAGVDVGVGEGVGVDMDTEPVVLPPLDDVDLVVDVGVGDVDTSPDVNSPLSTVAEIALNGLSYNVITSIFSGLEPVPTAVNSTFAKMRSPLAPPKFDADIAVNPAVLSLLNAAITESELSVTSVTCTTDGS